MYNVFKIGNYYIVIFCFNYYEIVIRWLVGCYWRRNMKLVLKLIYILLFYKVFLIDYFKNVFYFSFYGKVFC